MDAGDLSDSRIHMPRQKMLIHPLHVLQRSLRQGVSHDVEPRTDGAPQTSHNRFPVCRVVAHNMKGFASPKPLGNGLLLALSETGITAPNHNRPDGFQGQGENATAWLKVSQDPQR
jgi:hypothetical protein